MIRDGRKLPRDVQNKLGEIIQIVKADPDVIAFYAFGSLAAGTLKPLSDLDFGILLKYRLDKAQHFNKHIELIGVFNDTFRTDEIDLIIMNDVSFNINYQIIKSGKLLLCNDKQELIDFREYLIRSYLDFKFVRDDFDSSFLKGIGYHG